MDVQLKGGGAGLYLFRAVRDRRSSRLTRSSRAIHAPNAQPPSRRAFYLCFSLAAVARRARSPRAFASVVARGARGHLRRVVRWTHADATRGTRYTSLLVRSFILILDVRETRAKLKYTASHLYSELCVPFIPHGFGSISRHYYFSITVVKKKKMLHDLV